LIYLDIILISKNGTSLSVLNTLLYTFESPQVVKSSLKDIQVKCLKFKLTVHAPSIFFDLKHAFKKLQYNYANKVWNIKIIHDTIGYRKSLPDRQQQNNQFVEKDISVKGNDLSAQK